jgi:regulation of enolase protein 1 (concanavalin A-like superfamily)
MKYKIGTVFESMMKKPRHENDKVTCTILAYFPEENEYQIKITYADPQREGYDRISHTPESVVDNWITEQGFTIKPHLYLLDDGLFNI